jgi:hypothetical protein
MAMTIRIIAQTLIVDAGELVAVQRPEAVPSYAKASAPAVCAFPGSPVETYDGDADRMTTHEGEPRLAVTVLWTWEEVDPDQELWPTPHL